MLFRDRHDAGVRLASKINPVESHPVVLALPRGGVPVGYEVAQKLGAPLDVLVVRKLGVPGLEELAFGAIARGGVRILKDDIIRAAGIPKAQIDEIVKRELEELERREKEYRAGRPPVDVKKKRVYLVDDGLATGATMSAAVQAVRQLGADPVIVAVPVAPPETCRDLKNVADDVICMHTPQSFRSVGEWYEDFTQTTDEEVKELLAGLLI